jgi:MFS family permease
LWGRVATRRGHHLVLLICALGVGLYPVLTGLAPSQFWLPAVALVQGFFVTGIDLAFFDTLLHICPRKERPRFVAVNSVFVYLALSLAPLVGSALADWLGIRVAFYVAGALHLVAAALFLIFRVGEEESGSTE